MPLIVYLDTQDYINVFNEADDGFNHQVLSELLTRRDHGEIVIGFSFATVAEFITKPDVNNRSERVRRGELLKYICGPNAFPYITDLARGCSFPNGGKWMFARDENVVSAKEFRGKMHERLVERIAETEGLNRNVRRHLSRKASMAELFRRSGRAWGLKREDYGDVPISDEILESRIIERFIKGQCSDYEFETAMNSWISDPAEFSRLYYDYSDMPNFVDKYFGATKDTLERVADGVQQLYIDLKKIDEERLALRKNLIELGINKSKARELTKPLVFPVWDLKEQIESLEKVVGKGRADHFGYYMERFLGPGYGFKRSDVMDLTQMCYAYDCDLFRCDKAMANTFREFGPFKGKLVDKFADLPGRINALL